MADRHGPTILEQMTRNAQCRGIHLREPVWHWHKHVHPATPRPGLSYRAWRREAIKEQRREGKRHARP
jgi:hypothetical protein